MSIKTQRLLTRAKKLVKKGSIEEAKKLYSMILKDSPQNQEAKLGLLALKDLKDNQEPPQANIQSIVALYSNDQIQEALVDIEALVKDFPNSPILYNIRASCYKENSQMDASVKDYEKAITLKPDYAEAYNNLGLVSIDLDLPDGDGVDIIARESNRHSDLPIMVISVFGDESHVIKAIQAGARGYLLKDSDSTEIRDSIRQLLEGGSPISPSIARHLIKRFQVEPDQPPQSDDAVVLSEREHEVLVLASKGFSYTETAEMLDLSVNTVASYTKRIYGKLAVNSRSEAVYEATRMGIMNNGSGPMKNGSKRNGR